MQIEQSFTLQATPALVWEAFQDVQLLVDCLPGASIRGSDESLAPGDEIPLLFKVKLGPIAASFAGKGQLTLDHDSYSGSFSGSAIDSKTNSRVKGVVRFELTATEVGAVVTMSVDHTVTGALAQFSREGIVRALAEQLTHQFSNNLQTRMPKPASSSPVCGSSDSLARSTSAASDAVRTADNSAIDLWTLLKVWLRSLFVGRRT